VIASRFRAAALSAALLLAWAVPPAASMTFSALTQPDGTRIVLGEGAVAEGDSGRLRLALQSADRDASGYKLLALDSPGGAIVEAFAMVDVMDEERVSTLVRPGASCASACAQILFLSGAHRTVDGSGRIGLHSCHTSGDRGRSMVCNELIARNAAARGSPYGAILAFLQLTAATEMHWLSGPEADGWGFTRKPSEAGPAARPVPASGSPL